ncbi:MAG: RNA polymerase sigma factor [Puniceicoccaceae bacterium]
MEKNLNGENWREWFNEWGDRFLLFARQQSGSYQEAEDILQEVFVHIWTRREAFPRIEPGLVFTHIRRKAIDSARSRKRRQLREQAFAEETEPPLFTDTAGMDGNVMQEALQQLPREQREVLVLKVWGDQTFESIGTTLDISPNTAASRYRYGLEQMRRLMKGGTA